MTIESKLHDKYKAEIIDFLNNRKFQCVDFEKIQLDISKKTPDIKEIQNEILIEVKLLLPNPRLLDKTEEILRDLSQKKSSSFFIENTENFPDHLQDARRKFRSYFDIKTMVIFVNLMGIQGQSIEELIEGEETYTVDSTHLPFRPPSFAGYKGRYIRQDLNTEIGVVAEYLPKDKKLIMIHNSFAETNRRIPYTLFKNNDITQKEYQYNNKRSIFKTLI